jgi:ClpP class serine protease
MGGDAIDNGLVDELGGLANAIALAREEAQVKPGIEIEIVEFPPRPLIAWPRFGGGYGLLSALSPFGGGLAWADQKAEFGPIDNSEPAGEETEDYSLEYLKVMKQSAGAPVLMTHPDVLPEGWRQGE